MYYPVLDPQGNEVYPIGPGGYESRWRVGKDTYTQLLEDDMIVWKNNNQGILAPYVKYYAEGRTKKVSNLWNDIDGNKRLTDSIKGEFSANGIANGISHTRGTISMARRNNDYDSASSEFFIMRKDATYLDGGYAAFGHVTEGMDVVDKIVKKAKPTDNNGSIELDKRPVIKSIKVIEK